jgi:riboflavin kinase/FMN adenylyltransferase
MLTFRSLQSATPIGPTWVTIGNFDGVHLGHQALILRARELAAAAPAGDGQTAMVTFDPHPFAILRPDKPLLKLTTPPERLALAAALGVDVGVTHPFTAETARMEAHEFVELLVQNLGMKGLVVGPDFALGRNRSGDIPTLRAFGREFGFEVEVVAPVEADGRIPRSSAVRDLLQEGDVETAARLLGRPYAISGEVRLGDQRGRTIGVPTANVAPPADKLLPANGVYATVARLCTPAWAYSFPSVTNIGVRPTVDGFHHRVEAHLLHFPPPELPDNLYGQSLTLDLIARLRGETRFESLDALVAQIQADIRRARAILHV